MVSISLLIMLTRDRNYFASDIGISVENWERIDYGERHRKSDEINNNLIIEFYDYECPFCKEFLSEIDDVQKYNSNLKVVYVNYQLEYHENAKKAAFFSQCASLQYELSTVQKYLFDNQDRLGSVLEIDSFIRELSLNRIAFEECLSDNETALAIKRGIFVADSLNIKSIPSVIIKGKIYNGIIEAYRIIELLN